MMFQEKIGVRSVRLALGLLAGFVAGQALAQDAPIQRVEITGSSIKRIVKEGALPVQVVSKEVIARSGATTVADLIQKLPAMQGFTIEAIAAGTNSGGRSTASIHGLGGTYTLVLLNGRRMAPFQDSGSSVNLNSIPMSAVERVEVLSDGASALYGADAIAGVINFILKKNYRGLTLDAGVTVPTNPGGKSANAGFTWGFGDLETNRFNLLMTYRHDEQKKVKATEREFSKTSYIPLGHDGQSYIYDRTSTSGTAANVNVAFKNPKADQIGFNPYKKVNGACPTGFFDYLSNTATTEYCAVDSASTVETVPESKRDTLFTSFRLKFSDNLTGFADLALGRFDLTARIAANPVSVAVPIGSPVYNQYVAPYLSADQRADVKTATATYRATEFGTRDSRTITDVGHFVVGLEANAAGWDMNTGATYSKYQLDERYTGGYLLNKEFRSLIGGTSFNPFLPAGSPSSPTAEQINGSVFRGSIREAYSVLRGVDLRASRELFTLPGGASSIGLGGDYRELHQVQTASAAAKNGTIYSFTTPNQFDYTRDSAGAFAELALPLMKNLEVTTAIRYDRYSGVEDKIAKRTKGETQSASTYKISARYTPTTALLLRGSYGTGFRVADQNDIANTLVANGFTSAPYACPADLVAIDASLCRPGVNQYNSYLGGNEKLRPEESKQFTLGFRLEPSSSVTFGADLWDVKMTNQVSNVGEIQAFANPAKYRQLFTEFADPATGIKNWAFIRAPINIGKAHNRGIDWDLTVGEKYSFGKMTLNVNGTHMLKASYTIPGSDTEWTDSMDKYGIDNQVTFRDIIKFGATLETGPMTNALTLNYRNGYTDQAANLYNVATKAAAVSQIRLQVPSYSTVDYQGKFAISKMWEVRGGIKNLMDKEPPLTLRTSQGHQVGYDARYADTMGRTVYLNTSYKF
ncbi:TonB-dependent receptor [Massilia pseudoviolaceinigra]|uniref:TonB-dependent receptor n=1 Tax=Massilia pseudoviolaceinigra TaxID=3057165 RepID=UPI002796C06E|nr:TonB-dependent receptor [Massilia sp. CCM 9206]MDQ1922344.1 TonB-dependent receptor [Massilia sp. CCM 9206]